VLGARRNRRTPRCSLSGLASPRRKAPRTVTDSLFAPRAIRQRVGVPSGARFVGVASGCRRGRSAWGFVFVVTRTFIPTMPGACRRGRSRGVWLAQTDPPYTRRRVPPSSATRLAGGFGRQIAVLLLSLVKQPATGQPPVPCEPSSAASRAAQPHHACTPGRRSASRKKSARSEALQLESAHEARAGGVASSALGRRHRRGLLGRGADCPDVRLVTVEGSPGRL
jgi:hypothetical protein